MKKIYLYSIISLGLAALVGCSHKEQPQMPLPATGMTITAVTEGNDTKAYMGEVKDDNSRSVLWEPGDSIRLWGDPVYQWGEYCGGHIFVNTDTDATQVGSFDGYLCEALDILAIYPQNIRSDRPRGIDSEGISYSYIDIPDTQYYREDNFPREAFLMAAYQKLEKDSIGRYVLEKPLEFKNLCGILALNLVGEDQIRSITISAKDSTGSMATLSGYGKIKRTSEEYHKLNMMSLNPKDEYEYNRKGKSSVTLVCPDVQLAPETPTTFHIVLPPGKYSAFALVITTADGKTMVVDVNKELVINRSKAKHTTNLTYTEAIAVNLSEKGTANSYIVTCGGVYTFNASVIGNGADGVISDADFHTDNTAIEPASAQILWEDISGLISNVIYDAETKQIKFISTGKKGNALVAAKDENGTILWSWHIWCTDEPEEHYYVKSTEQTYCVLDRNLGATRADKGTGEQWKESVGLRYQWGRKDPFASGLYQYTYSPVSILESIQDPTNYVESSSWVDNLNSKLWLPETKTIYDPCPLGYKVPTGEVFEEITLASKWDNGYDIKFDGSTNTAWYPRKIDDEAVWHWIATGEEINDIYKTSKVFHINRWEEIEYGISGELRNLFSVRCMADQEYIIKTLPIVTLDRIEDVSYYSAKAFAAVSCPEDIPQVTSMGLVWSKSGNPSLENCISYSEVDVNMGDFEYTITNLEDFTTYHVRAYAKNANGVAYSNKVTFTTEFGGTIHDLSESATANCYIVPPTTDHYSIDLSVIGNGSAGIIDTANFHTEDVSIAPHSVEVVWAIKYDNYYGKSTEGDLISYKEFDPQTKRLHFVPTGEEGNLLLAAKDEKGTILWSWHLWITDKPQDHNYINHEGKIYTVMDRNIGATRADRGTGEQWRESSGLVYQWGRKDPFHDASEHTSYTAFYISESILYPTHISYSYDWIYSDDPANRKLLWSTKTKTIYDPCPVGYKVAPRDTWTSFTTTGENVRKKGEVNMDGSWDNGYWFIYNGTDAAWYPNTMYAEQSPWWQGNSGGVWSGDADWGSRAYYMDYYYSTDMDLHVSVSQNNSYEIGSGRSVRCVTDSDHNDIAFPYVSTIAVEEVSSKSAKARGEVVSEGISPILERGFVWGRFENPTTLNSSVQVAADDTYIGTYEAVIQNLEPGVTYYIRAYAKNEKGTSYGKNIEIKTKKSGNSEGYEKDDDYEW